MPGVLVRDMLVTGPQLVSDCIIPFASLLISTVRQSAECWFPADDVVWGGDWKLQTVTKIKVGKKYLTEETCEEYLPLKKEYILLLCGIQG